MTESNFIETKVLDDDILVVKLHGKLDVTTSDEFKNVIQKHLDEGKRDVILDCAHLGYVSSYGFSTLVFLQTRLKKQGGEVKLAAIQGPVAEILKIVHLDKVLAIYGDTEFARQSFLES